MDRLAKFHGYANHAWLAKTYRRLSAAEVKLADDFLRTNEALDKGAFELAVNRMFIDRPKPKNWAMILELLTCCNS